MPIVITAASGHLGRLAVEALIARGVTGSEIVAAARSPERIADLADSVRTARIDYHEPATVRDALDDGDTFVLISGNDPERRSAQHAAVIEAAVDAGAGQDRLHQLSPGRRQPTRARRIPLRDGEGPPVRRDGLHDPSQ